MYSGAEAAGWDSSWNSTALASATTMATGLRFVLSGVEPDEQRSHGLQYSLTLHDENGERVLGYDNSHVVDAASGPARRSRRSARSDHVDRRGRRSLPYVFTTPFKLVEDFFAEVDAILKETEAS